MYSSSFIVNVTLQWDEKEYKDFDLNSNMLSEPFHVINDKVLANYFLRICIWARMGSRAQSWYKPETTPLPLHTRM